MKHAVFVVTAAYGKNNVVALGGQRKLLPIIALSGADGVEIRRELLTQTDLQSLPELARAIASHGLRCFYSAPQALFATGGASNPLLPQLFAEAEQLGAERLKLSLGHFTTSVGTEALAAFLHTQNVKLLVENDQTACGTLAPLQAFFNRATADRLPVSMTFDMGNWHWVGQPPLAAADALAAVVNYIHVKVAARSGNDWQAVPPEPSDPSWRQLLEHLPDNVPRGIEFPLAGKDLVAETRRFVALLQ
ncbi:sugar phosphate isomerase/epimerase [Acerihabitans sp. TG2]|uniref:sugar phosphate isomerase/epimerase family protein n=1 Tax=Acerihabitans sp. TG2 TaxID=3096008 RepID=UPI002B235710|nr:sugar phosphate isomerase/epimerase [Acerihabitans sp. TG2]MEA9389970.1 sugar phosphate isomerase/epimerase [Acerihabitans sp. TG2]